MFAESLQFLVSTLFGLMATAFWLRFYLQWSRVPFHHPFAQFIVRITDFAVKPLRRVVPGFFGMDWSSVLPFLLLEFVSATLMALLDGYPLAVATTDAWLGLALLGLSAALVLILQTFVVLIIVQAVLSWVSPVSPASALFHALTAPVLNPFRRIVPTISGVDLSPLVAFIVIQLVMMAPVALLERSARALM